MWKILAAAGLIGLGAYIVFKTDAGARAQAALADSAAVGHASEKARLNTGTLEALKQGGKDDFQSRSQLQVKAGPDFSLEALIAATEQALRQVPRFVPNLPFMASLMRTMLAHDPEAIAEAPLPPGIIAQFQVHDLQRPKIVLSPKIRAMHDNGVPMRLLVPILVHELDHLLAYLQRENWMRSRNQIEERAFRAEGLTLLGSLRRGGKGDVEAVDATQYVQSEETRAYLESLRKIRKSLLAGDMSQLVRDYYGPDVPPR